MTTPKKLYPVEGRIDLSSCRLCWSIGDSRYCKNLFREVNRDILDFVQQVHGGVLPQDKTLPQLVCRSCERKVKNAAIVEKTIAETQRLLVEKKSRAKRGVSSYLRQPPHLNQRIAQKFPRERGLTFEACAAASSSLSQVGVFMVILFYISTRCSCFV